MLGDRHRGSALHLVFGLLALGIGVVAGAWLFSPTTPEQLISNEGDIRVPLSSRSVSDTRTVEIEIDSEEFSPVLSSAAGTVTSVRGGPGVLASGETILEVDGKPIVALATPSALWRPLTLDDSGDDVLELQTELARLGYQVSIDGQVGPQTLRATAEVLEVPGSEVAEYQVIAPSSFVWIPAESVTVEKYIVTPSSMLQPGVEILILGEGIKAARISEIPQDALPGQRTLLIDGETITLGDDGQTMLPEALHVLQGTESFENWREARESTGPVHGQYSLLNPSLVYVVPPAAIFDVEGSAGCVIADDRSRKVTIVSSELGQSLVRFDDADSVPCEIIISSNESASCK